MYHHGDNLFAITSDKTSLIPEEDALTEQTKHVNSGPGHPGHSITHCLIISSLISSIAVAICLVLWYGGSAGAGAPEPAVDTVLACYYNTPPPGNTSGRLLPADIDPHLCTHIYVAFARVLRKRVRLEPAQAAALRQVVALKGLNPALKVLLSVGGAGPDDGYSEMVADHASRKTFIKSIKATLRDYSLDGVDLDWEFPALHASRAAAAAAGAPAADAPATDAPATGAPATGAPVAAARERQHFSQLLREIRAEYARERRPYLLTVAVAAPPVIVDVSYDVDQIDLYVDFANVMTYDYHYYSAFTPFTGLNSPLYRRPGEELYPATLNVNHTVHMYVEKGLRRSKIAIGIPTYGHSFTLVNAANAAVGAPASGVGALGGGGFAEYAAACGARAAGARVRRAAAARVPYLVRGREWLSYDEPRSVADKAAYARRAGLRGAMLYSLNADDHAARCADGGGRFPLARAARRALLAALPAGSARRR